MSRDLDDDIDLVGHVPAGSDSIQVHALSP
jgi:hypothetical protein